MSKEESPKKPDHLADIFGIPSLVSPPRQEVEIQSTTDDDFEYVRKNMIEIIEIGKVSLENAADVADQAQHPRNYESVSQLMSTVVEAQKKLLELRELRNKLEGVVPQTINNNLIVTSDDMMEKIRQARAAKKLGG